MRIIAGKLKGFTLHLPSNKTTRPLKDRVRESIFNLLTHSNKISFQFENSNVKAPNLTKLLNDESVQKIFHYARFDMATLKHALKTDVKNVYCTKIASKIARTYTNNHGLKDLCKELLNVEISKKQQSSDWGNSNLSKEQITYAANDVIYLHQIKNKLDEMLVRENRQLLVDACLSFLPTRVELDLRGWENDIFSHSS